MLTGLRPDLGFLDELRLGLDERLQAPTELAPLIDPNQHSCGTVYPHGHRELSHPEKDVYLVGMKSYGRAPTFLAMTGYEQVAPSPPPSPETSKPPTASNSPSPKPESAAEPDSSTTRPRPRLMPEVAARRRNRPSMQLGVGTPGTTASADEAPAGGCCGS